MAIADFCTVTELLTYMRSDATGIDATTSAIAITAASDMIRDSCNRTFEIQGAAADRYFTAKYPYSSNLGALAYWYPWPGVFPFSSLSASLPAPMLEVDDFYLTNQTIGNITVTDTINLTTFTPTTAWPFNAASKGDPYTKLVFAQGVTLPTGDGQLKVNAKWGFVTAAPTTIKNACLLQAARFVKRRDSTQGILGVVGMDPTGTAIRVPMRLDADVRLMLGPWHRWTDVAA